MITDCEECGASDDCLMTCNGRWECHVCNLDDPRHVWTEDEMARRRAMLDMLANLPRVG